jgi:hypothetical protein
MKDKLLTPRVESSLWTKRLGGPLLFGRSVLVFMDSLKILIWNVWGLNRKGRRDDVRCLIASTRPDVVCLQETKKEAISR